MSETEVTQKKTKTRRVKKTTKAESASTEKPKTTRKRKVVKKNVVATEPVPESVVEETAPDVVEEVASEDSEMEQHLQSVTHAFEEMSNLAGSVLGTVHSSGFGQKELRLVNKAYKSVLKALQKVSDETLAQSLKRGEELQKLLNKRIRKNKGKSNPNSGIQKKHPAHTLLAEFLGVNEGDPVSRVEALKAISAYVKENNLQVPTNKKTFHLKGKLHDLFPDSETMGYTEIMKAIKPFFPPAQK